jgi:hypothetical protein
LDKGQDSGYGTEIQHLEKKVTELEAEKLNLMKEKREEYRKLVAENLKLRDMGIKDFPKNQDISEVSDQVISKISLEDICDSGHFRFGKFSGLDDISSLSEPDKQRLEIYVSCTKYEDLKRLSLPSFRIDVLSMKQDQVRAKLDARNQRMWEKKTRKWYLKKRN